MGKGIGTMTLAALLAMALLFPVYAVEAEAGAEPPAPPSVDMETELPEQEVPSETAPPPTAPSPLPAPLPLPPLNEDGPDGENLEDVIPPNAPMVPAFTAELEYSFEGWGLYGALSAITEDMTAIVPCYSLDGENYTPEEYNTWQLDPGDPDLLRQQCFWPMESPLKEYLDKEIDRFYLKLQITYKDGSVQFTQAVPFAREGPAPLPEEYHVEAYYAAPIREIAYQPLSIGGRYHFTVLDSATPEALAALLPSAVPVELQIWRDGESTRQEVVVDYAARWPAASAPGGGAVADVLAMGVTPPEECAVTIGAEVYIVKPPSILPENGSELCATLHGVPAGLSSPLLLSIDGNVEADGIRATLPLKPTGATRIVPEYSLDGETGWTAMEDVLAKEPLEEKPPRFEGYTARILGGDAPPLTAYLNRETPGFYVRLSIEGGALAGTTQRAAWPADYDYVPPRDDTDDDGGVGNKGNAGSNGSSGDNSDHGGQRPELPVEPPIDEAPPAHEIKYPITIPIPDNSNLSKTPLAGLVTEQPTSMPAPNTALPAETSTELQATNQEGGPEPAALPLSETPIDAFVPPADSVLAPAPTPPTPEQTPEKPERKTAAPILAVAATVVLLGGGITVVVVSSTGGFPRLLRALRKLQRR